MLFRSEAEDFFAKWGDEGEVDLLEQLSELIVLTASRCLLGREIRETLYSEVTSLVHDLDKGMVMMTLMFVVHVQKRIEPATRGEGVPLSVRRRRFTLRHPSRFRRSSTSTLGHGITRRVRLLLLRSSRPRLLRNAALGDESRLFHARLIDVLHPFFPDRL